MSKWFAVLVAAIGLFGCMDKAKTETVSPIQIQMIGEKYVKGRLKDPEAAQFQGQFVGKARVPCGEVNSKNGFGGYTGFKRYIATGPELTVFESDMAPNEFDKAWSQVCR